MMDYQWNIFWADLNPVIGSEQRGRRPVLVVSEEIINQALPVVTVLAITTLKESRNIYPVEVLLSSKDSNLPIDSIVMAHQIRSISKERLTDKCGFISDEELRNRIRDTIKLYLDIL